jgi:SpoIID/LytB domain protein
MIMDDQRPTALSSAWSRRLGLAMLLVCTLLPAAAWSQGAELSSSDRLRMLYAAQLTFTPSGDPLVRLGLVDSLSEAQFTPSAPIRVLPTGEGGPEIELPANRTYTVSATQSQAGTYKHWIVVDRVPISGRESLEKAQRTWLERGYPTERFEVGGLFAVRGKVFDSRAVFLGIGGMANAVEAETLQTKLRASYGIEGGIHAQLVSYPSNTLTLRGDGLQIAIKAQNFLQVSAPAGQEEQIRYKIPNIPKTYGSGVEPRTYTGSLIFAPDRSGKIVVINSLGAERILKGVVPSEIFASAPPAALQAQAIAARNEIFAAVGVRNLADPYMLRTDIYDQVYKGVGAEDARTSKAVDETRGQVMFYGDEIVEAFYSANAGGHTENNENVWDMAPRPYLRGKADAPQDKVPAAWRDGINDGNLSDFITKGLAAYSKDAPVSSTKHFRWDATVEATVAEGWLKQRGQTIGALKGLEIMERGRSGRVVRIKLIGERGESVVERELNVRKMFGGLKSGLFLYREERDAKGRIQRIHFQGAGFGHGVGMCQTGATGMAAQGKKAADILKHYYQGIEIKKLY